MNTLINKYPSWIVALFSILLFAFMLGSRPYSPSEARYAELPRNMAQKSDYVTPRLNGVKYFEKPPLVYWMGSVSSKYFKGNEWAHRFWPALLGLLVVLATYHMGRFLKSKRAGFIAGMMMSTSVLFYACTRLLLTDMAVSAFMTLSLYSFFLSTRDFLTQKKRLLFNLGFFVSLALAVLSKGLIGLILPGGIVFLWILITKPYKFFKNAFHPLGILLFLAIALPWHILAHIRNPEFFDFYIIHEHFTRYLTTVHSRNEPFWYFIPILFLGLFPWVFMMIEKISLYKKDLLKNETSFFFFFWAVFMFLFFSFSNSKMIPYILPVIPPLILLGAFKIDEDDFNLKSPLTPYLSAFFCIVFMIALPILAHEHEVLNRIAIYLGVIEVILGLMVFVTFKNKNRIPFLEYIVLSAIFLMVFNVASPIVDDRSIKSLALKILKDKKEGDSIIAYDRYYQDLPVYLNQRVIVVEARDELDFGMRQEDVTSWMMPKVQFFEWIKTQKSGYIVLPNDRFDDLKTHVLAHLEEVDKTNENVLLKFENK
ncbi:MAG: Undecaprenyl phosphate-alpha-4-amino-4-deoxy-L-arabinose arabinosyl transferase [Holosporales bacterium]